jgi:hypothetical protein
VFLDLFHTTLGLRSTVCCESAAYSPFVSRVASSKAIHKLRVIPERRTTTRDKFGVLQSVVLRGAFGWRALQQHTKRTSKLFRYANKRVDSR